MCWHVLSFMLRDVVAVYSSSPSCIACSQQVVGGVGRPRSIGGLFEDTSPPTCTSVALFSIAQSCVLSLKMLPLMLLLLLVAPCY